MIYVGANDGMLHVFDARTGKEIMAYVPALVYKNLKELKNPDYAHRYFVDLTPTVAKGQDLLAEDAFGIMLVGGLGKGGQGYFALNITDPAKFDAAKDVLWEFPDGDDTNQDIKDMGYSFSKPVVVRSYSTDYPWIVIFGNGYGSENGQSALFVLNPKNGKVITKIETQSEQDNGLSSPIPVDVNNDQIVDFVYAGDLKGNLWKFDFRDPVPDNWEVAYHGEGKPQPLFQAMGPGIAPLNGPQPQPITTRPEVMYHPTYGLMVIFGTGKYLAESDYDDTGVQTIYGIWDHGDPVWLYGDTYTSKDATEYLGSFNRETGEFSNHQNTELTLLEQTAIWYTALDVDKKPVDLRLLTNHSPDWQTNEQGDQGDQLPDPIKHAGWYFDLPGLKQTGDTRERVIGDVIILDGVLIAIGFIPDDDRCEAGGSSVVMEFDPATGGRLASAQFDFNGSSIMEYFKLDEKGEIVETGDYVAPDAAGFPMLVPPSGLLFKGLLQPPAIVRLEGTPEPLAIKYFSSSEGTIEKLVEKGVKMGVSYWIELQRE